MGGQHHGQQRRLLPVPPLCSRELIELYTALVLDDERSFFFFFIKNHNPCCGRDSAPLRWEKGDVIFILLVRKENNTETNTHP